MPGFLCQVYLNSIYKATHSDKCIVGVFLFQGQQRQYLMCAHSYP